MKKTEKKVISMALLMSILFTMLMPSISSAAGEVTIKDSKLKEAIAEQVDDNEDGIITEEEMKNLETIVIPEGVTDLTGLEYATKLSGIEVEYSNTMPDFSGVGAMDVSVVIGSVPDTMVKLDFLKDIENVSSISIINLSDEDYIEVEYGYKCLKEIKTLQQLVLSGVTPSTMEDIGQISGLESLIINRGSFDGMICFTGIENLTNLSSLTIFGATVPDISEVGQLRNLSELMIDSVDGLYNADLSSLANCTNLQYLFIHGTDISDLSFLKNKESLRFLSIISAPIKDISVISTLPNLEELHINIDGIQIEGVEEYRNKYEKSEDSSLPAYIDLSKNPEKTSAENENKTEAKKPTRIPQAGINVVEIVISLFVVMSVAILAVAFKKTKRK